MNINEIRDAALNGRTFRFTGKINSLAFKNGTLNIDWVFPDAGKPFTPSVDLSYIELAPKYDPSRLFKKGDKATPRPINGRKLTKLPENIIVTVTSDEDDFGAVNIEYVSPNIGVKTSTSVMAVFLELVTPVEELEPYSVKETMSHDGWQIVRDGLPLAIYDSQRHPYAKAAAEAERDRLNAEYRKEQNNG